MFVKRSRVNLFPIWVLLNTILGVSSALQVLRLGLLVDYEDQLLRGISNETIESLLTSMKESLADNVTIETRIIVSYDEFEAELEDDPKECRSLVAIISALSCTSTKQLYEVLIDNCPTTAILAIHERNCPRPPKGQGIGFPVMTSVIDVIPMLVDMRHDFLKEWDHINLIYDSSVGTDTVHDLVEGVTSVEGHDIKETKVTVYRLDEILSLDTTIINKGVGSGGRGDLDPGYDKKKNGLGFAGYQLAEHIRQETDLQYFILIGKTTTIQHVIEETNNKSLLGSPRKWIFIFTDVATKKAFWDKVSPILGKSNSAIVQREVSEYGSCGEMKEGCQMRLAFESLHEAVRVIAADTTRDYDFSAPETKRRARNRLLSEIRLQLGNDQTAAQYCGNCDKYVLQIFTPKKPGKKGGKKFTHKKPEKGGWVVNKNKELDVDITISGQWSPFHGLTHSKASYMADDDSPTPAPYQGNMKPIIVGIIQQLPRIRVNRTANGQCDGKPVGVTPSLVELLAERLNFTIEWNCASTEFGIEKNGQWTGLMGQLVRKEIVFAANGFWRIPSRKSAVVFSIPYDQETIGMMVQKTTEDHKWLFMLPFTYDAWWCVFAMFIMIGPLLWYVNRQSRFYDYYRLRDGKGLFTLNNCIWYTYGAMVGQGGEYLPQAIASRILVAFWWLFVIVTVTTYSGNLVAVLTFPKVIQPIQNENDLLDAWGMDWGIQKDTALQEVIRDAKYGPITKLRKDMLYMDFEEKKDWIFKEVADDDFAWIANDEEIRYWVSKVYVDTEICELHLAKDAIYRTPVSLAFRKDTDKAFIQAVNMMIHLAGRSGLISHWLKYYATLGNDCMYPLIVHAGDVRKIEMVHMHGGLRVLGIGLCLSVACLLLEMVYLGCIKPRPVNGPNKMGQMKGFYDKVSHGPNAYPRINSPSAQQLLGKNTNLSFIHPQVQVASDNKPKAGFNTVYGNQYGNVYNNNNNNATQFNTTDNFNYYNYAGNRNYKGNFGMQ